MNSYYIWTIGCQMNKADSERLASALEQLGLHAAEAPRDADVVVLNSCVVRQNAEDKVAGTLSTMKPLKTRNPDRVLALMGCMVGPKTDDLKARFPMWIPSCAPRSTDRCWTYSESVWGWTGRDASAA